MLQAKLENLERILHGVADERERLKVELEYPRPRITIVGDPSSPAAVPENPDSQPDGWCPTRHAAVTTQISR